MANSPKRPHRPLLLAGVGGLFIGEGLLTAHFGQVWTIIGVVLILIAAVVILKAFGWMFTRRF